MSVGGTELSLFIAGSGGPAETDALLHRLSQDIRALPISRVERLAAGPAPPGAKSADWLSFTGLAVFLAPIIVERLIDCVLEWVARRKGLEIAIKGAIGGADIDLTVRRTVETSDEVSITGTLEGVPVDVTVKHIASSPLGAALRRIAARLPNAK